jgi:PPE-repeat protein
MAIDYGMLPPEINSGRMYTGPGSGPLLAAAGGWDDLAAELYSAGALYSSAISALIGRWRGASSVTMAAAVAPYAAWMTATAARAEQTASQAKAAAAAFEAAFAAVVPPPIIAVNRAQLLALTATNFFGQNSPAIMATQAEYLEMWAQDAVAMYGYAGSSAMASQLTPFASPPQINNAGGPAGQAAVVAHATATATQAHATLAQLTTATPSSLQSLASPFSSAAPAAAAAGPSAPASPASSLADINGFITGPLSPVSLFSIGGVPQLLGAQCYLLPQAGANLAAAADKLAAAPGASSAGLLVSQTPALAPVVSAGVGRAGLVGGLSVPQGWAIAAPAVKSAAAVYAQTSLASAAAAAPGEGTLFGNMALSGLAGRAIAGVGGTAARSAGAGAETGAGGAGGPVNIFIVPAVPQ